MGFGTRTGKVILVAPPIRVYASESAHLDKNTFKRVQPWLGLAFLASVLEERGHQVVYLDTALEGYDNLFEYDAESICYGLGFDELKSRIAAFEPDVVGISGIFSSQSELVKDIARCVKEIDRDILTVVGGAHATFMAEQMMSEDSIDVILKGEADYLFEELVSLYMNEQPYARLPGIIHRDRDGNIVQDRRLPHLETLETLPMLSWHLIPMQRYWEIGLFSNPYPKSNRVVSLSTSRGCPGDCSFCSGPRFFGHKVRAFSASRVIDEIRYCVEELGGEEIQFLDDTFTFDYHRVIEICEGIKDLGISACTPNGIRIDWPKAAHKKRKMFQCMKEAGFYQVSFGIESGNQWVLDHLVRKRLHLETVKPTIKMAQHEGLLVHAFFVLGLPGETKTQMLDTVEFARSIEADSYSFSVVVPLPGTDVWEWCEKGGLFVPGFKPSNLSYRRAVIQLPHLTGDEVEELARQAASRLNRLAMTRHPENLQRYEKFVTYHRQRPSTKDLGARVDRFLETHRE